MLIVTKFIFTLSIQSILILAIDYCKICKKRSHTLCRFMEGPSDRCVEYKKPDFTMSVKKYIVDVHNDIRNHVASGQETKGALGKQAPAANMNILQWDNELAEIAQRWADQCIDLNEDIQHDECRKTDRFEVGQNVLTAVTTSTDIPEIAILILNWYKQVQNVLPSDIEHFSGIQRGKFLIGQYTQLVWAETRFFGCGMSTFRNPNSSSENSKYLHRLVCNYGPRGNLIGSKVYEQGIPCSKCPFGKCDSVRTSLCEGMEESNTVFERYNGKLFSDAYSKSNVDIPLYLFTSANLQYILKNNLTEFVQSLLQNMNVHLGHDNLTEHRHNQQIKCSIENSTETFGLDKILTLLSTAEQKLGLNKLNGDLLKTRLYFKPFERTSLIREIKKMANLMSRDDRDEPDFETKLYELENGEIIVDECKTNSRLCQYEVSDDELNSRKLPESGEIVLPDNIVFQKLKGTWFQGKCRCNYVYRSAATLTDIKLLQEFLKHVLTFVVVTCVVK